MRKLSIYYTFLAILSVILASCSVTDNLDLEKGRNEADIHISDTLSLVLNDYEALFATDGESISFVDGSIDGISSLLSSMEGIVNFESNKIDENNVSIAFDIEDVSSFLSSVGSYDSTLFSLDENSFTFFLSLDNYDELCTLIPFLEDPNFEVYGPKYNEGMSEDDYLEMMLYILGDNAPDDIRNSVIQIAITAPGEITSSENVRIEGNRAIFEFPLLSFLLLESPLTFSISWQ